MKIPALLKGPFGEVVLAITPLVGVACVLQLLLVQAPWALFGRFLAGAMLAAIGMHLLFIGIDYGVLPMGRYIGAELPRKQSLWLIVGVAFALGFATTVAEPDVLVLSGQVEQVSGGGISSRLLTGIIASSVGVFVALSLLRILFGFSMRVLLTILYALIILLALLVPSFVPLAFDAGSVTTGVVSAPVIMALALGLSSVIRKRADVADSFGLLGIASIGPIIFVLLMGLMLG